MVRWPARRSRRDTRETESAEIEFFDEGIDDANRVVRFDIVIKAGWQQRELPALFALDESAHIRLLRCLVQRNLI